MGRGNVDDAALAGLLHQRYRGAHGMEGTGQIDGDDPVPFFRRKLLDGRDMLDAGIVDEHIHRAEFFVRGLDEVGDLVRFRHIRGVVKHTPAAFGFQQQPQFFDLVFVAEAVQYDIGALPRKSLRDGKTDTACRACHDNCPMHAFPFLHYFAHV
ncbi:hypothetical protein D3C78_1106430 [compost metagenome]